MFKLGVAAIATFLMSGSANAATLMGSVVYGSLIENEFTGVTQQFNSPTGVSSYADEFFWKSYD